MDMIECQCWQKLQCKLRRERSHDRGHGHVIIPSDEEDDEMRQALLLLTD